MSQQSFFVLNTISLVLLVMIEVPLLFLFTHEIIFTHCFLGWRRYLNQIAGKEVPFYDIVTTLHIEAETFVTMYKGC